MTEKEKKLKSLRTDMIMLIVVGGICLVMSLVTATAITETLAIPIILAIFSGAAFIMAAIGKVESTIVETSMK